VQGRRFYLKTWTMTRFSFPSIFPLGIPVCGRTVHTAAEETWTETALTADSATLRSYVLAWHT
jgi:hypothetical protein